VRLAVRTAEGEGQGSGFVIDKKGTIVTNAHVIADAIEVTAFFSDGFQERIQGIVGISADKDLAANRSC
jgi:putative serine protease PepD